MIEGTKLSRAENLYASRSFTYFIRFSCFLLYAFVGFVLSFFFGFLFVHEGEGWIYDGGAASLIFNVFFGFNFFA